MLVATGVLLSSATCQGEEELVLIADAAFGLREELEVQAGICLRSPQW